MAYTADMLGTTETHPCDGCDENLTMTLSITVRASTYFYFWACPKFEEKSHFDGRKFVDPSNWEHTVPAGTARGQ